MIYFLIKIDFTYTYALFNEWLKDDSQFTTSYPILNVLFKDRQSLRELSVHLAKRLLFRRWL